MFAFPGRPTRCLLALGIALAATARPTVAAATTYNIIYSNSSINVHDVLAADAAGRLYVASVAGDGDIISLAPPPGGSGDWVARLIYEFGFAGPMGGLVPYGGVTLSAGAILGTANGGGVYMNGTVYRLDGSPAVETTLHAFDPYTKGADGNSSLSGLTEGLSKLFYGTCPGGGGIGGNGGGGTVFAISASVSAPKYAILHRFGGAGDGATPQYGRLWVDAQGRLYGTTKLGGANGNGTVFMLQFINGGWQEQVLYSFQATNDLFQPVANVVLDASGNVYGCAQGGAYGQGGLFRLTPPATGGSPWVETILIDFGAHMNDPVATDGGEGCGITINPATTQLFGTSYAGGFYGKGTIFEVDPPANGKAQWTETLIHSFNGSARDGFHPIAPPLLVGTTYYGGTEKGSIYAFVP